MLCLQLLPRLSFAAMVGSLCAASWLVYTEASRYTILDASQLRSVWVGVNPPPDECCHWGQYKDCTYPCNAPPLNCPPNITTYGSCGAGATCSVCDVPQPRPPCGCGTTGNFKYIGNQCTTRGLAVNCQNPPGSQQCDVLKVNLTILTDICNVGVTVCVNQPPKPWCQ